MLALGALVLLSVLLDPSTFHLNASDAVVPAPSWQLTLALMDAFLVVLGAAMVWRGRADLGFNLLVGEFLWNLALCALLVSRDGIARFVHGFGGEEYLSLYLAALALRVILLFVIRLIHVQPRDAAA